MENCYQGLQACQQGDVGVAIIVSVVDQDGDPVDLHTATSLIIRLGAPDGTAVDKTAIFVSDGSDGQIVYTTVAEDLDQAGEYEIQGIVTMGGATKSTAVSTLQVLENVPAPVIPEP